MNRLPPALSEAEGPAHHKANHKARRKRGGQEGNQNARKHGFYSSALNLAGICEFWNIINKEGVDPEIAALRIKMRSLLQHDPGNRRVLREASRLLAKWYSTKYQLDRTNSSQLKRVIWKVLENYLPDKLAKTNE